jgi:hypothetical protein
LLLFLHRFRGGAVAEGNKQNRQQQHRLMKTRRFTTEQVAAVARGDWRDCEFTDIDGLRERFSIKRSLALCAFESWRD